MIKLALSALLSAAVGAAGTYFVVDVKATCAAPIVESNAGMGMKDFLAKPYQPMTGPTYK
jgi:hypothetical protein